MSTLQLKDNPEGPGLYFLYPDKSQVGLPLLVEVRRVSYSGYDTLEFQYDKGNGDYTRWSSCEPVRGLWWGPLPAATQHDFDALETSKQVTYK